MAKEKETKVEEPKEEPTISVDEAAKKALEPEKVIPTPDVVPESESQKIDRELREKNQEIADLKKKQQESKLDSERVAITEHFHCQSCGRVFYPKDGNSQIRNCLLCNPQRQAT